MSILDWFYPPRCMACRVMLQLNNKPQRELWLCERCKDLFEPVSSPICNTCGSPMEVGLPVCVSCHGKGFHFSHNRAAFVYADIVRDLLHELKFRNKKHIAQGLGRLWAEIAADLVSADALLVPLPMHRKKQRERGFNQAEVLAVELSKKRNIPMANVLERIADTPPQSGLHPKLRAENVMGAFGIRPGFNPRGQHYILVDDIYTTGASLNECAKTLKDAGAADVSCMTLAVTVKTVRKEE